MGITYHKNPGVGTHPDLFEEEDTPMFVPLADLTEEQIVVLPMRAFSEDEWEELEEDIQIQIYMNDPQAKAAKRSEFTEDNWEALPEAIQDMVHAGDEEGKELIKELKAALLAPFEWMNDPSAVLEHSEGDIDFHMDAQQSSFLWDNFGDDILDRVNEQYEGVYDDDIIEEVAMENALSYANFEYSATMSPSFPSFSGTSPGYYIESEQLEMVKQMTEDQIQIAIDEADDDCDDFSYLNITPDEIEDTQRKSSHGYTDPLQREADYDGTWSIEVEPNWDEIMSDMNDNLPEAEEQGLPEEDYVDLDEEERVLARITLHDGVYKVLDLLPTDLKKETKKMNICVGKPEFGYMGGIKSGRLRILSVRPESGEGVWKRTFTIEVALEPHDNKSNISEVYENNGFASIDQVKGQRNRTPGFGKPTYGGGYGEGSGFDNPEEAKSMMKVIRHLGFNPEHVQDMKRSVRELKALESGATPNPHEGWQRPGSRYTFDMPTRNQ
jgi:hypothetical protein